jgi:hypothetical protein
VGPIEIKERAMTEAVAKPLDSHQDLLEWLDTLGCKRQIGSLLTVTFVIDVQGRLRIADRRSEHVVCAGNGEVLSAGEMTLGWTVEGCVVQNVTNQSTGYCPEAESWPAVDNALSRLAVPHPVSFDPEFIFRRCESCHQTNIVKDRWFACSICGAALPEDWNYETTRPGFNQ